MSKKYNMYRWRLNVMPIGYADKRVQAYADREGLFLAWKYRSKPRYSEIFIYRKKPFISFKSLNDEITISDYTGKQNTYIVIILIPSVCFFYKWLFRFRKHFCIRFAGMLRIYAIINAMKNGFTASKILAKYCVILLKLSKVLYTAITATQNTNAIIHP